MANLTKTSWPLGWVPTQDDVNGDPGGLLRMDNLQQDSIGALTIARGMKEIYGPFQDYIANIWSKVGFAGASESLWVGLNQGSQIIRSLNGTFSDFTRITAGSDYPVFGDGFGYVFIFAGVTRWKDNGTAGLGGLGLPLGLLMPGDAGGGTGLPPTVVTNSQPMQNIFGAGGSWSLITGSDLTPDGGTNNGCTVTSDPIQLIGQILYTFSNPLDTTNISGAGPSANPAGDYLQLVVNLSQTSLFTDIIIDFILNQNPTTPANITDYYTFDFQVDGDPQFVQGSAQNSTLGTWRDTFTRCGTNTSLDWTTVTAIRITGITLSSTSFDAVSAIYQGGATGQLNGVYVYALVNISDNGIYEAKSPISPSSLPVYVINGSATITPPADFNTNPITSVQVYRMSVSSTNDPAVQQILSQNPNIPDLLNTFYLVGTTTPETPFVDNTSDLQALQLNINPNQFLLSVQDIPGSIIGVEGPYFGLMLYITGQYIYLSDSLDPDAVDQRYTIKAFGDPTEQNLWLKKLTNGVLILGTTKNLYEISGTLQPLPDGTIDATVTPIGENYPPLSRDVTAANATIFYVAADGLRYTQGSNSQVLSTQLNLTFQGETRFGFPAVAIYPNGNVRYPITVAHGKLFCSLPMVDGSRWLAIYNIARQTFTVQYTDPICLYGSQSDRILGGFGAGGAQSFQNNGFYQLEDSQAGGFYDSNGSLLNGYKINFLTVYDSNQQPRNRKVLMTLKIVADTGGAQINVFIGKDGKSAVQAGSFSSNGMSTSFIPLYNFNQPVLGPDAGSGNFRIQIQLLDANLVTTFRLEELTVEYDPYPEQLNYLVLQPNNMGNYDRKRWTSFAFVIDTLGNEITFNPIVDGVELSDQSITFSTQTKQTVVCYFDREVLGTDISGTFIATTATGIFEYFGTNEQETVSEKLPTPCTFLVIPPNNYGTPNRKRHSSYKFQILTRGKNVTFTPILDGVSYPPAVYNTTVKKTVEYFFAQNTEIPGFPATTQIPGDVIAIDIGGTLASDQTQNPVVPFEFYGVIEPQTIEKLPDRLEFLRIPNSNLGYPGRKRLRTLPIVIDTYGQSVLMTTIIDGIIGGAATITTSGKLTTYLFFNYDIFPIDIGVILESQTPGQPFEFYELSKPEDVEMLPVPKIYDQLGPQRFDKIGKLFGFRTRLISTGDTSIPYQIITDQIGTVVPDYGITDTNPSFAGSFPVTPFVDNIWEVQLPKSINGSIVRIVLGPTNNPFHRYDMELKVQTSGMETESQWMPVK